MSIASNSYKIEKNSLNVHIRLKVVVSVILVVKPTTSKEYALNWLIRHIGHVCSVVLIRIRAKLGCTMNLKYFPFDSQDCPLLMQSCKFTMRFVQGFMNRYFLLIKDSVTSLNFK